MRLPPQRAPGLGEEKLKPPAMISVPLFVGQLIGATQGKEDARSRDAADLEIYSSFVEDRVAVSLQRQRQANTRFRRSRHCCRVNTRSCCDPFRRTRSSPVPMWRGRGAPD